MAYGVWGSREEYRLAWRRANKDHLRKYRRGWKRANRDRLNAEERADRAVNPDKYRTAELRRRHANPGREAERVARRRTRRLNATPAWVDHTAIRKVYELAAVLGMDVDHIHPLAGKNFCGLHVPWNLQILTGSANASKGNKLLDEFV